MPRRNPPQPDQVLDSFLDEVSRRFRVEWASDPAVRVRGVSLWVGPVNVTLTRRPGDGVVWLDTIRSTARGHGHATSAIEAIRSIAKKHHALIQLRVEPFGPKKDSAGKRGLSRTSLEDWYRRHGFKQSGPYMIQENPMRVRPNSPQPQWVKSILKDRTLRPRIDRWLATVAGGVEIRLNAGQPECYGSGHYGSAFALESATGDRWVLKVTRDPTEGPICDFIGEMQRDKQLLRGGFARFESVAKLPDAITFRRKSWPVYLIVREEVDDPGQVGRHNRSAALHIQKLQESARAMLKKSWIGRRVLPVGAPMFSQRDQKVDASDAWERSVDWLSSTQGFSAMAEDLRYLRELGVTLLDVHCGNVGLRGLPQEWPDGNVDGTNIGDWIIFDPGHTPTGYEKKMIRVLDNPQRTLKR